MKSTCTNRSGQHAQVKEPGEVVAKHSGEGRGSSLRRKRCLLLRARQMEEHAPRTRRRAARAPATGTASRTAPGGGLRAQHQHAVSVSASTSVRHTTSATRRSVGLRTARVATTNEQGAPSKMPCPGWICMYHDSTCSARAYCQACKSRSTTHGRQLRCTQQIPHSKHDHTASTTRARSAKRLHEGIACAGATTGNQRGASPRCPGINEHNMNVYTRTLEP